MREAKDLRVTYWDFRTDTQLVLVNEGNPANAGLYSQPRDDANTKVAPDALLLDLVDFAAKHGFFERAEALAAPDELTRGTAFRMIVISAGGLHYACILKPGLGQEDPDAVKDFTAIQQELVAAYNSVHQLQYIGASTEGGSFFEKEQERLRRENMDRTRKGGNP
ncbi:MAG: hypothetical protein HY812_21365 [Planctomycetes bacterium]|nr:hypothetical protein [Planctomycetota bacterium]